MTSIKLFSYWIDYIENEKFKCPHCGEVEEIK